MTDILERLLNPPFGAEPFERKMFKLAADEIVRLQRERDKFKDDSLRLHKVATDRLEQVIALTRERDEALALLMGTNDGPVKTPGIAQEAVMFQQDAADYLARALVAERERDEARAKALEEAVRECEKMRGVFHPNEVITARCAAAIRALATPTPDTEHGR